MGSMQFASIIYLTLKKDWFFSAPGQERWGGFGKLILSRLANLRKDGWIKVNGSGRGTFYTVDYGQEVDQPK